jgi:hypothetical protein
MLRAATCRVSERAAHATAYFLLCQSLNGIFLLSTNTSAHLSTENQELQFFGAWGSQSHLRTS